MWIFKVWEGVEKVRFGDLGTRLGFACDAINSYFVFKTLRDQGLLLLKSDSKYLPLVNSVIRKSTFTLR